MRIVLQEEDSLNLSMLLFYEIKQGPARKQNGIVLAHEGKKILRIHVLFMSTNPKTLGLIYT